MLLRWIVILFALAAISACSDGLLRFGSGGGSGGGGGGASVNANINGPVYAIALASDGSKSIFVGGDFTQVFGNTANNIALIRTEGSLDPVFLTGVGFDGEVTALLHSDAALYVGGDFGNYAGAAAPRLAKLDSRGNAFAGFSPGTGFNGQVRDIEPSNRLPTQLYVFGEFATFNGAFSKGIARLSTAGILDGVFTSGFNNDFVDSFGGIVYSSDGVSDKTFAFGQFSTYGASASKNIVVIDSNGSSDTLFSGAGFEPNNLVRAGTTGGGAFYVAGNFTSFGSDAISIEKFDSTINIVVGFLPDEINGQTNAIAGANTPVDRVYVGGNFSSYGTVVAPRIFRIHSNGNYDSGFDPGTGFNGNVHVIYVDTDNGTVYVGGDFTTYNGTASAKLIHLESDGSILRSF